MPDPITIVGTNLVAGAANALGHECVRRHKDDIAQAAEKVGQSTKQAWDDGWQRDYEAGGISSLGNKKETGLEPA